MRHAVSNDCHPTACSINRNNRINELFNALHLACENNNLGWSPSLALTTGKGFLNTIATALFYLDPHPAHGRPLRRILGVVEAINNDSCQHVLAVANNYQLNKMQSILGKDVDAL